MVNQSGVTVLGVFVADTAYYCQRMPKIAETISASNFVLGPGGKGSNQAAAAAKAGAEVAFISKIGKDSFGRLALDTFQEAGVTPHVTQMENIPTGAAFIYVNENNGDNSVIIYPGAAGTMSVEDVESSRDVIEGSSIFITQLEQSVEVAQRGLEIASSAGVTTIFNPAPAKQFPEALYPLCDYFAPNEIEAADIVGFEIVSVEDAQRAGDIILQRGAKAALITLGVLGVVYHTYKQSVHIPAMSVENVVDTTGAGDSFLGGFAAAMSRGDKPIDAVRFGCVTAGIAVTRPGTVPAMPRLNEIEQVLLKQ